MKNLIFCDVDGTIIDGTRGLKKVTPKTIHAFNELKKDNYIFIASGRCMGLLDPQIKGLKPSGFVLCNGAYAEIDGKSIYEEYFDHQTAEKIMEVALKYDGFYVLESLHRMFVNDVDAPQFIKFLKDWGESIEGYENRNNLDHRYHVAMIGFQTEEDCLKSEIDLKDYADLGRHGLYKSYDVNKRGIHKGIAVKKVMEYLNIDKQHTYCFGDGINDLEMLQAVGHPVRMANADDKIKGYDFEDTLDVLEDGFYDYLVKHKLIKPL